MADIPEGYGIIAGRSKENALKALDAANVAGVDQVLVRTVKEGYLVPEAVLKAFEKANKPAPEPKKAPAKKPAAKAAAKTDEAPAESETDNKEE